MMIPSIQQVIAKRHAARRRLKWWALAFLIVAQMPLTYYLINALLEWRAFDRYALRSALGYSAMFLLPAILLWACNHFLARRIVIIPEPRCPRCNYLLHKLTLPRCPECGTEAPLEFVEQPPN